MTTVLIFPQSSVTARYLIGMVQGNVFRQDRTLRLDSLSYAQSIQLSEPLLSWGKLCALNVDLKIY